MKQTTLLLLAFSLAITSLVAQNKVDDLIKFTKTEYDFGKVKQGKPVTVEFAFTNPSSKPLIIEDATAECGCTKPEYPTKPVMGGKAAVIKVTYDAKEAGVFTKRVTVKLVNEAETKILTIKGEVVK